MNASYKDIVIFLFVLAILAITVFVISRFIPPLAWAAIIAIATWPIYQGGLKWFGKFHWLWAFLLTLIVALIIFVPISWLAAVIINEVGVLIHFLIDANTKGQTIPSWIASIPFFGAKIAEYWQKTLGQPGGVSHFLNNMSLTLEPASHVIRGIGLEIFHRTLLLLFALLFLFFFYKDGKRITEQIHRAGKFCCGDRWTGYAIHLPGALRGTVNGSIFMGLGIGLLMGISYWIAGIGAPALLGLATGVLAMIPFGMPIIVIIVCLILFAQKSIVAAIAILVWGSIIMFITDHFLRPKLIGNATRLPFLAVFLGILGGVETLGLLGLFLGPVIMVLFLTMWKESQHIKAAEPTL